MPDGQDGMIGIAQTLNVVVIPGIYAICHLPADESLPTWATAAGFFSVTRTPDELSIVCETRIAPAGIRKEGGWRGMAVRGPLDFDLTGIIAALAVPLAAARISIFVVSTYETDFLLVRDQDFDRAVLTLRNAGHNVSDSRSKRRVVHPTADT